MTQFKLADELRRGGIPLLAQAVADLRRAVVELNPGLLPDEDWLHNLQARAAAVPAGNQAKAPTALDEMRARPGATDANRCEPAECDKVQSRLIRELEEAREALARVEADRDELKRVGALNREAYEMEKLNRGIAERKLEETDGMLGAARRTVSRVFHEALGKHGELVAAQAELHKHAAVVETARRTIAILGPGFHPIALRPLADALSALDQAASKAAPSAPVIPDSSDEVGERAIVVGSKWRLRLGSRDVLTVTGFSEESAWNPAAWHEHLEWVSDPEATESATKGAT